MPKRKSKKAKASAKKAESAKAKTKVEAEAKAKAEEKKKQQEKVAKVAADKAEEDKDLGKYAGKKIGLLRIPVIKSKELKLEGREYHKLTLANGTTTVLSSDDLEKQIS